MITILVTKEKTLENSSTKLILLTHFSNLLFQFYFVQITGKLKKEVNQTPHFIRQTETSFNETTEE
jgi:hypothetical protein